MNEKVKLTIEISEETYEKVSKYADFLNLSNHYKRQNFKHVSEEDVLKAALNRHLDYLDIFFDLDKPALKQLSEPYAIKNKFKERMDYLGMKQGELSELTNIYRSNLSGILNNKTEKITLDTFLRIWVALGCPPLEEVIYRDKSYFID